MYGNEQYIRGALDQWEGGQREDVFIQSNWGESAEGGCEHDPERSLMETLRLLGTDYLDLCESLGPVEDKGANGTDLIHGPNVGIPFSVVKRALMRSS